MIKTVIIDDEPRNIKLISRLIQDYCPGLAITGTTDNLAEAVSLITNTKPSLLLLDIEFPQGTIFPMLADLTFRDFQIIFITAHNNYAMEAFSQNAADYILKPVTKEALVNAVRRAELRIQEKTPTDISNLVSELKMALHNPEKIALPSTDGFLFVNKAEIIRCEANGRYTVFYLDKGKKITVAKTLKETETLLNSKQFFRIHHSHVINLEMIKKYYRNGTIELTDGSVVTVSLSHKDEFMNILMTRQG
jgi:two-component system, LytTR family, response regulator